MHCVECDANALVGAGYTLTTCGSRGRLGPNQTQCNEAYQNTPTKVEVLNATWPGVQVWTVPSDGLYTYYIEQIYILFI